MMPFWNGAAGKTPIRVILKKFLKNTSPPLLRKTRVCRRSLQPNDRLGRRKSELTRYDQGKSIARRARQGRLAGNAGKPGARIVARDRSDDCGPPQRG